jgi:hypothetical protein
MSPPVADKAPLPSPKRLPSARLLEAGLRAGRRNPEEYKTLGRSWGKFYRKNDQTFYVHLQRRLRDEALQRAGDEGRAESAMADRWAFFSSLLQFQYLGGDTEQADDYAGEDISVFIKEFQLDPGKPLQSEPGEYDDRSNGSHGK